MRWLATLVGLAALSTGGCIVYPSTLSAVPDTLHVRQICPSAEVRVVEEFQQSFRRWGLLGIPFGGPPDVASWVNGEVGRLKGDAVTDLRIRSDYRAIIYLFLFPEIYPRYEVSGTVVEYVDERCFDTSPS